MEAAAVNILFVFLGGGAGSLLRYAITLASNRCLGDSFGWGTMAANLAGCFLVGLVAGLIEAKVVPSAYRDLLVAGFLGGFTTFSAFSLETVRHFHAGVPLKGAANALTAVIGGFALTALGFWLSGRQRA
jgi:fluoride exporter